MIEIWKDIPEYEGYYQVSNLGNVRSLDRIRETHPSAKKQFKVFKKGFLLTPDLTHGGYLRFSLSKDKKTKKFSSHRLVAQAFIPNPENKEQVNHKDGNKLNNSIDNLEWCTGSENIRHAYKNGLQSQVGEKNAASKLTNEQVKEIKVKLLNGVSPKEISNSYPIHRTSVYDIINGRNWSHVILDNF